MTLDEFEFDGDSIMKLLDSCVLLDRLDELREYEFEDMTYDSIMYTDCVNGICYEIVKEANLFSVTFGEENTYYSEFDDNAFINKVISGCIQRNKDYLANLSDNRKNIADILGVLPEKKYNY